jgi:hypothetical protein
LENKLVSGAMLVIMDITGRIVETLPVTQTKGAVAFNASINAGIYFVKLINGTEVTSPVKILKTK